jgi:CRISPR/Cas system-associated exonuclease Cas4 (RecB family)
VTLSVFVSNAAAGRLRAARELLATHAEALVLSSHRSAADDFVRSLRATTFGVERFSVAQFAARVAAAALAEKGLTPITRLSAQATAAHVAHRLIAKGSLVRLAAVSDYPGFAPSLTRTLQELRLARTPGAPGELGALLDAFNAELDQNGFSDPAVLFDVAAETIRRQRVAMPLFLLDIRAESRAERDFLRAIIETAPQSAATMSSGDDAMRRFYASISGARFVERTANGATHALERLRTSLFSTETVPPGDFDDSVVFFSAPGEGREAVEVARAILRHARSGMAFDEMAVFLRTPSKYQAHIEAAFARAGIPAYYARGSRRPDPAGRALLALLACAAERLSARRFGEYLSLGQVPEEPVGETWLPPEEGEDLEEAEGGVERKAGPSREPYRWEELLVEAAVIGGKERWHRRLRGLDAELRRRLGEMSGDEPESARIDVIQRQLDRLAQLAGFALPLVDRLDALQHCRSWREWIDALRALAAASLRNPERVLEVLTELEPMAEIAPVGIDEVRVTLSERLSSLEVRPPGRRYGRVFVAPVEQAAGRSFRVVFIPGLVERSFPQKVHEDPLLLDAARRELSPELATRHERGAEERLRLQMAIGAAEETVYVSYPRLDAAQGRSRVASFYALDVIRAVTGRIPDARELEETANRTIGSRLAWPAPRDPQTALDDLEHDLAVLAPRLAVTTPGAQAGRARYLLDLNRYLAESLRARFARWELVKWNHYDGITRKTDGIRALLDSSSLRARPYSPSALQRYATCPHQFYLSAILRLAPREEPQPPVRLDPLTRGTIIHAMHASTLRRLKSHGLLPLTPAAIPEAERVLHAVVDEIAAQWEEDLAPAILRVWRDEITLIRTDLRLWLRDVASETDQWVAEKCEYAFGLEQRPEYDESSKRDPVTLPDGFLLRGSVDLIERRAAILEDLRVSDYKTGSNRTRNGMVIGGGETLQPLLYALAVEKLFDLPVAVSRLFFSTSRGGFTKCDVSINTRTRDKALLVLDQIDAAVTSGFLPPAPRVNTRGRRWTACDYCDFTAVCGPYEPVRAARKDGERLAPLERLRDEK